MYYVTNQAGEVQFCDDYETARSEFEKRVSGALQQGSEEVFSIVFGTCSGFVSDTSSGPVKVFVDATDFYKNVSLAGLRLLNDPNVIWMISKNYAMYAHVNNLSNPESLRNVLIRFLELLASDFGSEQFEEVQKFIKKRLSNWHDLKFAIAKQALDSLE